MNNEGYDSQGLGDDAAADQIRIHRSNSNLSGFYHRRKRNRGVVEKMRRDRINCSLSELRRLVPNAFEKNESNKLEKAEILRMAVEHMRSLQVQNFAPSMSCSVDYGTVGFRECAAQVASFLATADEAGLHSPLRMRLLGHLQAYCMQRHLDTSLLGPAAAVVANNGEEEEEEEETGASQAGSALSSLHHPSQRQLGALTAHHQLYNWPASSQHLFEISSPLQTSQVSHHLDSMTSPRHSMTSSLYQWDSLLSQHYQPMTSLSYHNQRESVISLPSYQPWSSNMNWHCRVGPEQAVSPAASNRVRYNLLPATTTTSSRLRSTTIDALEPTKQHMTAGTLRAKRLPLADIN